MRVKLLRKFANALNGIDLTTYRVGETFDLMPRQATLLIREGWAEEAPPPSGQISDLPASEGVIDARTK